MSRLMKVLLVIYVVLWCYVLGWGICMFTQFAEGLL